jgi:uncharacterized protein
MIDSPCTRVCILDAASGFCIGCGRTGSEIAAWLGASDRQRQRIVADLPRRLADLERARCGEVG